MRRTLVMDSQEEQGRNQEEGIILRHSTGDVNPIQIESAFDHMVNELEDGNKVGIILVYPSPQENGILLVLENSELNQRRHGIIVVSVSVYVKDSNVPFGFQTQLFRFDDQMDTARQQICHFYDSRRILQIVSNPDGYTIQVSMENRVIGSDTYMEKLELTLNSREAILMCDESLRRSMTLPFQGTKITREYSIVVL